MTETAGDRPELPAVDPEHRAKFEQLYDAHFREIYAFMLRRRPPHEVGDLVAETFAVAWRRIGAIPPDPDDKLWLYGVARNVLSQDGRASIRRQSLFRRLTHLSPSRVDVVEHEETELLVRMRNLITHLKPLDQEIIRLVAWESLSHAEVAEILGCSANTVAIRWHRSLERLRRAIDRACASDADLQLRNLSTEEIDGD